VLNDGGATADIAERLREEARLLGLLQHRAIVKVDGLVALDGRWTIVMEHIDGVDLRRLVQGGAMPVGPALEIIGEVAGALHAAQTQPNDQGEPLGLMHRDIKPSNILLTANGEVKVVDFGVARANYASRKAKTVDNVTFGSPGYLAPERMMAEELPAGDVYSLGVVLHDLLAEQPFAGGDLRQDKHEARLNEALEALGALPDGVPELLRELLAYRPKHRPTARQLERRCLDLRKASDDPWLRDWAESEVPRLPKMVAQGHDFTQSLLYEKQGVGNANATLDPTSDSFAPDAVLVGSEGVDTLYLSEEGDHDDLIDPHAHTRLQTLPPGVDKAPPPSGRRWGRLLLQLVVLVAFSGLAFLLGMAVVGLLWLLVIGLG
jgi:serine/threonine protein kinase